MCGIAGFYKPSRYINDYSITIKNMLSLIQHRGSDEAGYYVDNNAAMGTTRLSIIDIQNATQPLSDQSKRYWICYNGELYNYKELKNELQQEGIAFYTNSDTEVVLQAWIYWKEKCLRKFNGAFAFAIYDTQEVILFLARDRYGERPLFYSEQNGEFIFASEMKAFLGYDGFSFDWDEQQLTSILALWTPLPKQTGFKNIKQLPMGEYLIVNGERSNLIRSSYTKLNFETTSFVQTESDAIEQTRALLLESVKLRLRSDVEVGVYLSGGLDSSIITQLASEVSTQPVQTFSVEFEDKEFDESDDQKLIAKHFGTKHSSITITSKDISENFPIALFHAETPTFRTAFVPMFLLSKKVQDEGIKVVLSGEGADETFLGYDLFKETLLRISWNKISNQERKDKLAKMYPHLNHFNSANRAYLMGLYQQFSEEKMPGLFSHEMRFQNGCFSTRLLKNHDNLFKEIYKLTEEEICYTKLSPIQKAQWLEFKTLLPGYLLSTQGDRMSLAHGVENRCPFLDPSIVNFSSSVNLKFDDGFNEKYLLKKAFQKKLPKRIVEKSKYPYRAPDSSAFIQIRPDYLDLLCSDAELKNLRVLDMNFTKQFVQKIFSTPLHQISTKENQTFIFLLSLALLNNFFIKKEGVALGTSSHSIESILVKVVDMRKT